MRGQKRPQRERTMALVVAAVDGAQAASEATGIPATTIETWMKSAEFVELRARKKEEADAEWWAGIQAYQRSIMADLHSATLRDKVGAFAVMFEKWSLLTGQATARLESRDLGDELDDHERATLRRVLEDVAASQDSGSDSGTGVDAATATDTA